MLFKPPLLLCLLFPSLPLLLSPPSGPLLFTHSGDSFTEPLSTGVFFPLLQEQDCEPARRAQEHDEHHSMSENQQQGAAKRPPFPSFSSSSFVAPQVR
jgi:hypothetical protein